jgi:NDP-sugar pyrophosphorylase family protein
MKTLPPGTMAMIFAAGLGTRLKPFTDNHPKALANVNGKPLLQRNIEYLKGFGITEIVINVHHFADQIIRFLDENRQFGCTIHVSNEQPEPLETGGGLKHAEQLLKTDKPFIVMNADILTNLDLSKLYEAHVRSKKLATLAITGRASSRQLLYDGQNRLVGWKNIQTGETRMSMEHPHPIMGSFSGIQVIEPALLKKINRTGKFSIMDVYLEEAKSGQIQVFDHGKDMVLDVGKPDALLKAEQLFP